MKRLLLILVLVFISCKIKKTGTEVFKPNLELGFDVVAKVSKIDSIENYYLILIKNEKEFFKIVSDKNQPKYYKGIKVEIGKNYNFRIRPLTNRQPPAKNERYAPTNYLDIAQCRKFNQIEICTESSFELALASNLKGLYLKK